jgi:hypothetical protein
MTAVPRLARRVTLRAIVSVALWASLLGCSALVVHDFYRHVDHWVFLSVDDGLSNEAYALASQGRYGFLSSPEVSGVERHHGEVSYGPWYFYLAAGLIWLFGYSLTLVRSIHLWVILGCIALASVWFRGQGRAAAATTFGLAVLYAFGANQWPMARPDSLVSLFAVVLIVSAGLGLIRGGARYWFAAGLAASCGAFTHLVAASLVASSMVLFTVAAARYWLEAGDRRQAKRELAAWLFAFAGGGLLGAVMFYGSFGFRIGDQLRLLSAYRALVASNDRYTTVVGRHLFVAFRYLSPDWKIRIGALIASTWIVVALARLVTRETRSLIYGYVLPPITVWTAYIISNGWYTNQHKGYAILHEVMMAWVLASLAWVAVTVLARGTSWRARTVTLLIGLLLLAQGVRQIAWQLEAAGPRAAASARWVSIDDYVAHVLAHIPAHSTAWGSVMYGIETPVRLQLIQVEDAFHLMDRVDISRRGALAPDYLLWGYPEERDSTLAVLHGGRSLLGKIPLLTRNAQYRVASLVAAAPYGVTRVYARTEDAAGRLPALPDVSVFDAGAQQWVSRLGQALPVSFTATAQVEFALGYENDPRPVRAARTRSATVPPGRYLIRVGIIPGAGDVARRMLAATSPEMRQQRVGELGPQGDFTSYFERDRQVVMLSLHGGGPLEISQFDDGAGAEIGAIEVFPVVALLDPGETPAVLALSVPDPASWTPTKGLRGTALASGALELAGDASRSGTQLTSPKLAADIGDSVALHLDMTVTQGRACLGVLNGTKTAWLVSPDRPRTDVTFREDESRAFYVVSANCNDADTNPATRLTVFGGRYTIDPAMLYTDRLMMAVDQKPANPVDVDVAGVMPGLVTAPRDLKVTRATLNASVERLRQGDLAFQAPIIRVKDDGWTIAGRAESAFSYVLQSKPRVFDQHARLIAAGTVSQGGLTVGLLSKGRWAAQVNVTEPGPFTAVIAAPANGSYSIVAAHALPGSLDTSIVIDKLGMARVP